MDYTFVSQKFEGPLDLLLHLIKKADIDIFDINIADITDQYLKYIESMDSLDLNVDSEYLVMASELIELKSRELLPHSEEDEEEDDPKEELINRLVEYQRYKDISLELQKYELERKDYYTKLASSLSEFHDDDAMIDEDISLTDLLNAFMKFQAKKNFEKPLNTVVTRKEYSVHKRSKEIFMKLKDKKKINFEDLFDFYSKDYVVVTFLAILDLAKDGKIILKQNNNMDSILLCVKGENEWKQC